MDTSLIIILAGLAASAVILLRPKDLVPMLVNIGLIIGGTFAALWFLDNPSEAAAIEGKATDAGTKLLWFIACQPLVFIAARWLAKVLNKLPDGSHAGKPN